MKAFAKSWGAFSSSLSHFSLWRGLQIGGRNFLKHLDLLYRKRLTRVLHRFVQFSRCIPYRYREIRESPSVCLIEEIEVLVVSSRNGHGMLFPKGGWEIDESMEEAALRETMEEAGVMGNVEGRLGIWNYKSKRNEIFHEGFMFPLHVREQLDLWPEKSARQRIWMTAAEAREVCSYSWMKEALDVLVHRLTTRLHDAST